MEWPALIFLVLYSAAMLWVVGVSTYYAVRRSNRGDIFPAWNTARILHKEYLAGAWSDRHILGSPAVVQNCLILVVTPDELWTTSFYPFLPLVYGFGLELRIRKSDIESVRQLRSRHFLGVPIPFEITFRELDRSRTIRIYPWKARAFREALNVGLLAPVNTDEA